LAVMDSVWATEATEIRVGCDTLRPYFCEMLSGTTQT
jgi:hypothetical protein